MSDHLLITASGVTNTAEDWNLYVRWLSLIIFIGDYNVELHIFESPNFALKISSLFLTSPFRLI